MQNWTRSWAFIVVIGSIAGTWALAQQTLPPPTLAPKNQGTSPVTVVNIPPPPAPNQVAATVNGQVIPELAVYRILKREKNPDPKEARNEILNFLIETTLVDQFVAKFNIPVDAKEVDEKVALMSKEAEAEKSTLQDVLKEMMLSMEELRDQLTKGLRWDKFCAQQGTDKNLRDFFDKNKNMFDGSEVRARHILINPGEKTPKGIAEAQASLNQIRQAIEKTVAEEMSKLPPQLPALTREKERTKLLEQAFAIAASKHSSCPSAKDGGDVGWFKRVGVMVEPYSRAAFALKPHTISDIIQTEFGYHLIMVIDTKPGKEVRFEDVRPMVFDVYAERLRDAIVANQRPQAKIVFHPAR